MPRSRFLQRNQSAQRVGEVLDLLSLSAEPLSLQELSRRLAMHPSTAHRLLKTLEDQGLIARPNGTELYRLGPKILTLSTRMLNQYPVRDVAAPYLYRLALELGLTAAVVKYANGYITYLDCKEGPDPVNVVLRAGGTAPAHHVPSGRVQLAFLDAEEVDHLIERGLDPNLLGEPADVEALRRELGLIRQRGYATGGGWLPGVSAVAAPILDASARPIAAITVVGFSTQLQARDTHALAGAVVQAACEIAARMGFTGAAASAPPTPRPTG